MHPFSLPLLPFGLLDLAYWLDLSSPDVTRDYPLSCVIKRKHELALQVIPLVSSSSIILISLQ